MLPRCSRHARASGHPAAWLALILASFLPSAAKAEGMPQLDFANPLTTSQVVWGAIIFAVLYVLLSRIGLPKVGAVIEERARHIAADLETAQASKARSDEAAREVAEATARARAEAQAAINAALDAAKQEASARIAALNQRLEQQLHEAESADRRGTFSGDARAPRGGDRYRGDGDRPPDRRAARCAAAGWGDRRSAGRTPDRLRERRACTRSRASSPNRATG